MPPKSRKPRSRSKSAKPTVTVIARYRSRDGDRPIVTKPARDGRLLIADISTRPLAPGARSYEVERLPKDESDKATIRAVVHDYLSQVAKTRQVAMRASQIDAAIAETAA